MIRPTVTTFRATSADGETVYIHITELDAFVQASADTDIFVGKNGRQWICKKGSLTNLSIVHPE